jgi:hypothetical protein
MVEAGSCQGSLWVRSKHWELTNPAPGDVLSSRGIRISGTVVQSPAAHEGTSPQAMNTDGEPELSQYVVTGVVMSATDYSFDIGRAEGLQHGGTNIVLSVTGELVHAQIPGPAADIGTGSMLTLSGEVSLIADYEWDAFELVDTRRSWSIEDVRYLGCGDYLLLLCPAR